MKDRLTRIVITAAVMACMTGCGAKHLEGQDLQGLNAEYVEVDQLFEKVSPVQDVMVSEQQEQTIQTLNKELFDGNSVDLWNGKENTLLALKEDTLFLYDVASAQIKAETKTQKWDMVTFYPYQDGYAAIGMIMKGKQDEGTKTGEGMTMIEVNDEDVKCLGIFYDDFLNETQTISLDSIVANAAWDTWAVSYDGSLLCYFDLWDGLNLYDVRSQEKHQLLDFGKDRQNMDLLSIDAIFLEAKNSQVVFMGQTNQDGRSVESWGRINIDGTGLENHVLKDDFGMASGYSDGKLLIGEDSIYFNGGMGFIDTETGETTYKTDMKGTLPVSGPFFSADGTVFATAALDENQMELTVWNTADFSVLYKEVIQDDREEMFYRAPQVCLFPGLRTVIVCMGGHNDIPQKAVMLNY